MEPSPLSNTVDGGGGGEVKKEKRESGVFFAEH